MTRPKAKYKAGQVVAIVDESRARYRYRPVESVSWQCSDDELARTYNGWWYKLEGCSGEYSEIILRKLTKREIEGA